MPPSGSSTSAQPLHIGILEVQGAFLEHQVAVTRAAASLPAGVQVHVHEVRTAAHVTDMLDGLIIPGGESTSISIYIKRNKMGEVLREWILREDHVTWGTCAGMILLAKVTDNQKQGGQTSLEIMDLEVSRNFFGRQVNSFEAQVKIRDPAMRASCNKDTFPGVFIRAPAIVKSLSPDVEILGTTAAANGHDVIVAAKQGNVMTTAFHPELTDDFAWHLFFLKMILKKKSISV